MTLKTVLSGAENLALLQRNILYLKYIKILKSYFKLQ